jgi:hypothetical protein
LKIGLDKNLKTRIIAVLVGGCLHRLVNPTEVKQYPLTLTIEE